MSTSEEMVAMILAGGRGTRLKSLTAKAAKPAVFFGGKYRIIDFPLSNVANSGIHHVGILTQYESTDLNNYIGSGRNWGLNGTNSLASILPPRETPQGASWYLGTADAIYQNIDWLDKTHCKYVVILSGDHIYKMDYAEMLAFHKKNNADCTIACIRVPMEEAPRFGIVVADPKNQITEFQEKPKAPKSDYASMGIYIFTYSLLREALIADAKDEKSAHDFGKNILPTLLGGGKRLFAYPFQGYWKDVGTVQSLWESNMDLLDEKCTLDLFSNDFKIFSADTASRPQYIASSAKISDSVINQGAIVYGSVTHSVICNEVTIERDAKVKNAVILPGAVVKKGVKLTNAIVGPKTVVDKDVEGDIKEVALVNDVPEDD
ncbi:MAG: glucose-1-phosphate adenylyltransferase [Eubacteriales bacterium]|jgi:glucose-1-phosphate adenylyltransferase|nr:glucose-1-phosphate adenylyltransferase [Eubacteriales bacterium]